MTKYYVICAAVSALSWLSQFCTSKNRFRENSKIRHFVISSLHFYWHAKDKNLENVLKEERKTNYNSLWLSVQILLFLSHQPTNIKRCVKKTKPLPVSTGWEIKNPKWVSSMYIEKERGKGQLSQSASFLKASWNGIWLIDFSLDSNCGLWKKLRYLVALS